MTNETKSETKRPHDGAAFAVFGGLAANALTAFAIQAWMTFGFADEVWGIPFALCIALIAALDLFAIMFMILTYLLRGTGWPRGVATTVFVFAIGAQVAAAEMFGAHRGWSMEVRIFSVLPAVFLAAAQEGVVLWRTHRHTAVRRAEEKAVEKAQQPQPRPDQAPIKPPARPAPEAKPQVKAEVKPERKPEPRPAPKTPRPPAPDRGREDPVKAEAVRQVLAGEKKPGQVADELGKNKRTVELWVQAAKAATATATPVQSASDLPERVSVLPAATPVNGHATPAIAQNGGTEK
jgi:hypothetical protein